MPVELDETHDPHRRSWVESANTPGSDFPIQNLPFCVFRLRGRREAPRIGVGIGDQIFDLAGAAHAGLLRDAGSPTENCGSASLNALMALGPGAWRKLRKAISALLATDVDQERRRQATPLLTPIADAELLMPCAIGDFTDFYASVFHASNVGRLLRPDNPLLPNYKWVPIAYHGRSSSIRVSGTPVIRPSGQTKAPDAAAPSFGPSRRLDFETEMGFFVGPGNPLGQPIPIAQAREHVFGMCILNDWSARDIQAWEYQPLGPFLAKSFATTISPWVVTMDALAPYRIPAYERPKDDPRPMPYLFDAEDQASGALDISIDILLESEKMRRAGQGPHRLSRVRFKDLYWTVAQFVAHHTSNGCDLKPGDLLGSGTVSNSDANALGSLMELSKGGREPLRMPNGESRTFLEDGDAVIFRAHCERVGAARIGFGECRAVIEAART